VCATAVRAGVAQADAEWAFEAAAEAKHFHDFEKARCEELREAKQKRQARDARRAAQRAARVAADCKRGPLHGGFGIPQFLVS